MISYAQNFEDVMLARAFGGRHGGFYIDIGACFPDVASVTKHFYDRGWNGVNVEPMAEPFARLVAERTRDVNLNIAVAGYSGDIPIFHGPSVGESSALRPNMNALSVLVPCLTLADLCGRYAVQPIDFLKIDVEGLERDVVLSGNWDVFRPAVVVIEVTAPWTTNRRPESIEIGQYLAGNGYREVYFDGINAFYLASEASELAMRFAYPPNSLDRFVPVREADLVAEAGQARQEISALTSAVAAADLRSGEAQLRTRQEAAKVEVAETRLREAELRARQEAAKVEAAETRLREAERRASTAQAEVLQTASILRQAAVRARALGEQLRHAEASFAAIEQSNSWRLTAPLRWLRGLIWPKSPQHRANAAVRTLFGQVIRRMRRSGVGTRLAPWVRARYPRMWFRAKRMLFDSSIPTDTASITRTAQAPSSAGRTEIVQAASMESGVDALPGSCALTLEEVQNLINQQLIRQKRS